MDLLATLTAFFQQRAPLVPGEGMVVAFSGGPDSTALLWGLSQLANRQGLDLHAAHLDHAMDPGSHERAARAVELCRQLGVPATVERRPVDAARARGESLEAAGRRLRYAFLEEVRRRVGARYIATAHHLDDQAETVLLRLLHGSGVAGLAGIRPLHGRVVRPLLTCARAELAAAVEGAGLLPVDDPTNFSPMALRNRLRHGLLARLAAEDAELPRRLARIAAAAGAATRRGEEMLLDRLRPRAVEDGVAAPLAELEGLPDALQAPALALLHGLAGAPYPASRGARAELAVQIGRGRVGCDCGDGWRWERRQRDLILTRRPAATAATAPFSYRLKVPGEVEIPEIGVCVHVHPAPVAGWMFRPWPHRAGLALPVEPGEAVEIRNRRPGDRLQPFGRSRPRRLKEVLIDRAVPRERRDRLPLLLVADRIAWVPGVTIDERFRLQRPDGRAWIAELAAPGDRNVRAVGA